VSANCELCFNIQQSGIKRFVFKLRADFFSAMFSRILKNDEQICIA